ncbi:hypothetical protein HAX54_003856, partial [Datura stramonium]|nr:hypothetical protein [Datura stramonium]
EKPRLARRDKFATLSELSMDAYDAHSKLHMELGDAKANRCGKLRDTDKGLHGELRDSSNYLHSEVHNAKRTSANVRSGLKTPYREIHHTLSGLREACYIHHTRESIFGVCIDDWDVNQSGGDLEEFSTKGNDCEVELVALGLF